MKKILLIAAAFLAVNIIYSQVSSIPSAAGSGGGAPTDAQYLTLTTNGTLSAERVFTCGSLFTCTDGGAGSTFTANVDSAKVQTLANDQSGAPRLCSGSASTTATCTMTPTLTAYTTGMTVEFIPGASNTTTYTLNIDTLGAKSILTSAAGALSANDIVSGRQVKLTYDGTQFRLPPNPQPITSAVCMSTSGQGWFAPWGFAATETGRTVQTAQYFQFVVPCRMSISKIGFSIRVASGTCGGTCGLTMGIFDSSLTRLGYGTISSGGTPDLNQADKRYALSLDSTLTLDPGVYYLFVYSTSSALTLDISDSSWLNHQLLNEWSMASAVARIGTGSAATGSGASLAPPTSSSALTATSSASSVPLLVAFFP